jgi:hypothetical protein
MKGKPTTFELAQLAAQAAPPNARPKEAVRRAWALWHEAEAELAEHENRAEYLRGLFRTHDGKDIPLFTDSPGAWQARLKAYPGDPGDVDKALWDQDFASEEVQRQLFKDKTLSRDTRRGLFLGLVKAAILFELPGPPIAYRKAVDYLATGEFVEPQEGFPIHPKNLERAEENYGGCGKMLIPANEVRFVEQVRTLLSAPRLYAHLVRWAVEVRQRQLAIAKKRLVPGSLRYRRDEPDAGENIQFKRKHRQ